MTRQQFLTSATRGQQGAKRKRICVQKGAHDEQTILVAVFNPESDGGTHHVGNTVPDGIDVGTIRADHCPFDHVNLCVQVHDRQRDYRQPQA